MKKSAELPKLRLSSELLEKMKKCLDSISESGVEVTMSSFRRLAYRYFVDKVNLEGLQLKFIPK